LASKDARKEGNSISLPSMDRPIFLQKKMIRSKTHVDPSPNFPSQSNKAEQEQHDQHPEHDLDAALPPTMTDPATMTLLPDPATTQV